MAISTSILELDRVGKRYPSVEPNQDDLVILRDISLTLTGGASLAIVGPSGSGKSTLLQVIGGLDPPTSGTVKLNGINPYEVSERERARYRNRSVGFVFQDHLLLPQCSVLENVLIPSLPIDGASDEILIRARQLLDRVGLASRLDHRPHQLSGGERQRVALCRALINRPTLVLADEPTGNLDQRSAASVADVLLELARDEARFLILVTHSRELAERLEQRREILDGALLEG